MRFGARLPNDTATLLLMAVFIIVDPRPLTTASGDRASHHAVAISVIGAICLLGVYGAWLWDLPAHGRAGGGARRGHGGGSRTSLRFGIGLAGAGAGAGAALVSDWFVAAARSRRGRAIGMSKAFTGLVIVADRRERGREHRRR